LAQPLNEDLKDQREAGTKSIQFNDYPRRTLEDTAWRLERKKAEYRKSRKEHQNRVEEPRRREAALEDSVGRLGSKKEQNLRGFDQGFNPVLCTLPEDRVPALY
jgi:prefoldin subunit 5